MIKHCITCKQEQDLTNFHKNARHKDGHENRCKLCRKNEARKRYKSNPFQALSRCKKSESKKKGLDYNLDAEYLESIWSGTCPITGYEITIGNSGCGSHRSGHLDRLNPDEGYVKGNVCYISGRMNRIKYNATINELKQLIDWMERATTIS